MKTRHARCLSLLLAFPGALVGCASLNYSPYVEPLPRLETQTSASASAPAPNDSATVVQSLNATSEEDSDLAWSDLTRLAREHQRRGELEQAQQRLEQAAFRVSELPPTHTRRRAVFGLRARFAQELAKRDQIEKADALADQLIEEVRQEPQLAGPAFVSLALAVAERRTESDEVGGRGETMDASQLPLLEMALAASASAKPSRARFALAADVSEKAYHAGRLDLARTALDRAIADVKILAAENDEAISRYRVRRARIALAAGDYESALLETTQTTERLAEIDVPAALRGFSEATLAEALAGVGEFDRALARALGARERLEDETPVGEYSTRVILGALARVHASMGNIGLAREVYAEAIEVPELDALPDRDLLAELIEERAALAPGEPPASTNSD